MNGICSGSVRGALNPRIFTMTVEVSIDVDMSGLRGRTLDVIPLSAMGSQFTRRGRKLQAFFIFILRCLACTLLWSRRLVHIYIWNGCKSVPKIIKRR